MPVYEPLPTKPADAGLQVRFLGTSSFVVSDERTTLIIDGFVSRPEAAHLLLRRPIRSRPEAVDAFIAPFIRGRLAAVLVAHTHYDHALDSPTVAARWRAPLFGSHSLRALTEPGQVVRDFPARDALPFDGFRVTAYRTGHSRRDLAPGPMTEPLKRPAAALDYLSGEENYAFRIVHGRCRMLFVTSAGLLGEDFPPEPSDIVFLSLGRLTRAPRKEIDDYLRRALALSGAILVVPIHWDDPSLSLEEPFAPTPYLADRVDEAFRELAAALPPGVQVRLPPRLGVMNFSDAPAGGCRT